MDYTASFSSFAGRKAIFFAGCNLDSFTGRRITSHPNWAILDLKYAEAGQPA
jgi:hypothetical protein